jgi:hypothetical protein
LESIDLLQHFDELEFLWKVSYCLYGDSIEEQSLVTLNLMNYCLKVRSNNGKVPKFQVDGFVSAKDHWDAYFKFIGNRSLSMMMLSLSCFLTHQRQS